MKTRILTIALSLMIGLSSFANNKEIVNERILSSFNKEFAGAQEVNWVNGKTFAKATFKLSNQVMFAYYSPEGELLAVTRNITSGQLPINLLADLKKSYQEYWITDLFEMVSDNETIYYVTLESASQTLVMKSHAIQGWEVYKKEKK